MFADKFMFSVLKPILAVLIVMVSTNAMSADDISEVVGEMSGEALLAQYPAFMDEYKSYQPSDAEIKAVSALEDDTLLILFGTWCHDSQREVPRFLKVLSENADMTSRLIGLDYNKSEPKGTAKIHDIKFTPTFIVYRDNKEIGRIIERPKISLTADISSML